VVVIDCLTLWLTNLLLAELDVATIEQRVLALADTLQHATFDAIVVSNEVGMGIVPDNALARTFRDITGRAHQTLAARSTELYFATMGTVIRLRPAPLELVSP
jgi:adenosylcobinamide kinase/adenosylcobinamide-phosphate guanylyltransferase